MATTNAQFTTDLVKYINAERKKADLLPLKANNLLNKSAQTHSQNMATQDFYSTIGKNDSEPYDRMKAAGYKPDWSEENIAKGEAKPKDVLTDWMNDSFDRYNILVSEFTDIGVGYSFLENDKGQVTGKHYWTVDFASPQEDSSSDDYWDQFDNFIDGTQGSDTLIGKSGNDYIDDDDKFGFDLIKGMAGNDHIYSGGGNDTVEGGTGNDYCGGGSGDDLLKGEAGNDRISDDLGDDTLDGGTGDDTLSSCPKEGYGNNRLSGGDGNDWVQSALGNDTLFGGNGNDHMEGLHGEDILYGGAGTDIIWGDGYSWSEDKDQLYGEDGTDFLSGEGGDDRLVGGKDNDHLWGDDGKDTLIGVEPKATQPGKGERDTLNGYETWYNLRDTFVLGDGKKVYYNDGDNSKLGLKDYALIEYFNADKDVIQLHGKASDYILKKSPSGMPSGRAIYWKTPNKDELIAIVQVDGGGSGLDLSSNAFNFV